MKRRSIKKQYGGTIDNSIVIDDDEVYEDDFEDVEDEEIYEDDFEEEEEPNTSMYNKEELKELQDFISSPVKSRFSSKHTVKTCDEMPTLLQGTSGICYYVSLIHCLFFSRGTRKYVGEQVKLLESKLTAAKDFKHFAWFFIMLWNMSERPNFYRNVDWTYSFCDHLSTSLVASCQSMTKTGVTFNAKTPETNTSSKMTIAKGFDREIRARTCKQDTDAGRVGEGITPITTALQMNNLLHIVCRNYVSIKQARLFQLISNRVRDYEKNKNTKVDILAIQIPAYSKINKNYKYIDLDMSQRFRLDDEITINGSLYQLDAASFANKNDFNEYKVMKNRHGTSFLKVTKAALKQPSMGHVISGVTCPYADENSAYPRMVLNSWKNKDSVPADWSKETIVLNNDEMLVYEQFDKAVSAYNKFVKEFLLTHQNNFRVEPPVMLFSAPQCEVLYFYVRKEPSQYDNYDIQRIKETINSNIHFIIGEKPISLDVSIDNTTGQPNNNKIEVKFDYQFRDRIKQTIKSVNRLPGIFTETETDTYIVDYVKFMEYCQQRLRFIEEIMVLTGKVPIDIVMDDDLLFMGGAYPEPPAPRTRPIEPSFLNSVNIPIKKNNVSVPNSKPVFNNVKNISPQPPPRRQQTPSSGSSIVNGVKFPLKTNNSGSFYSGEPLLNTTNNSQRNSILFSATPPTTNKPATSSPKTNFVENTNSPKYIIKNTKGNVPINTVVNVNTSTNFLNRLKTGKNVSIKSNINPKDFPLPSNRPHNSTIKQSILAPKSGNTDIKERYIYIGFETPIEDTLIEHYKGQSILIEKLQEESPIIVLKVNDIKDKDASTYVRQTFSGKPLVYYRIPLIQYKNLFVDNEINKVKKQQGGKINKVCKSTR
jgi:hypothetical protein